MSTITGSPQNEVSFLPSQQKFAQPSNYVDLTTLLDLSKTDFPDIYNQLVQPFGDQSLMDFCRMIGAHSPLAANKAEWFEEPRLHNAPTGTISATLTANSNTATITIDTPADLNVRVGDNVLDGVQQLRVITVAGDNTTITVEPFDNWATAYGAADPVQLVITGNDYEAGTDQPAEFIESGVVLRESATMILKDRYMATGSQETNKAWIPIPSSHGSGGGYVWYLKNEADQRKRFENYLIMSMITGEVVTGNSSIAANISGTEGLVPAVKARGINAVGSLAAEDDIDGVVLQLAKIRADLEYTVWQSTQHKIGMDKLLAGMAGAAANSQYGIFNNDKNMALNLGFSSYERGGYTFHLKTWDLLNDPTLLGAHPTYLQALFIPGGKRMENKSGMLSHAFNVRYKSMGGYNRDMEHWITGSALGAKTDGQDVTRFEYRAEMAAQTMGANNFVAVHGPVV